MEKNPRTYLTDILESCDLIIANVRSTTLEAFRTNQNLQDAVVRRFEIIGEAVKKVPEDIRKRYPDIPWKYAAGLRDVLIHDYAEVLIDQVYVTGTDHLPAFRSQIQNVLDELRNAGG